MWLLELHFIILQPHNLTSIGLIYTMGKKNPSTSFPSSTHINMVSSSKRTDHSWQNKRQPPVPPAGQRSNKAPWLKSKHAIWENGRRSERLITLSTAFVRVKYTPRKIRQSGARVCSTGETKSKNKNCMFIHERRRQCTPPDVENATVVKWALNTRKPGKEREGESINKHVCGTGKHSN